VRARSAVQAQKAERKAQAAMVRVRSAQVRGGSAVR